MKYRFYNALLQALCRRGLLQHLLLRNGTGQRSPCLCEGTQRPKQSHTASLQQSISFLQRMLEVVVWTVTLSRLLLAEIR